MRIVKLTEAAGPVFETVCGWICPWNLESQGWSPEKTLEYLRHSLCQSRLPQTFVGMEEGEPVGVYQLSYYDLDVRPDLYPWLANLYVEPGHRGRGLSAQLIRDAVERARALGFSELYLYTHHEGLYEKYGFTLLEMQNTFEYPKPERLYVQYL